MVGAAIGATIAKVSKKRPIKSNIMISYYLCGKRVEVNYGTPNTTEEHFYPEELRANVMLHDTYL